MTRFPRDWALDSIPFSLLHTAAIVRKLKRICSRLFMQLLSSLWIPDQETHHTTAGIAQLIGHGPHGWARLCGTPDSLLMTHGLLLKIGLHGGCYDPQPVTHSS